MTRGGLELENVDRQKLDSTLLTLLGEELGHLANFHYYCLQMQKSAC